MKQNEQKYSEFSLNILKASLLKFKPSSGSNFSNCHSPKSIEILTRLRLGLSPCVGMFRHSFQDSLNPICPWGKDTETLVHFLLRYPNYPNYQLSQNIIGVSIG